MQSVKQKSKWYDKFLILRYAYSSKDYIQYNNSVSYMHVKNLIVENIEFYISAKEYKLWIYKMNSIFYKLT